MPEGRFGTAITCIDGRVQMPVADWAKRQYILDYVDMVTLPGPDKALAEGAPNAVSRVRSDVDLSVARHGSTVVAVVGHHDCSADPCPEAQHREQIGRAVQVVRLWNLPVTVVGLWVNAHWQVEVVSG